ncbi:tail protein X [Nitrosomonas oligotropha]|uniref:P2-like prophage tail protein X n=1 Tax=Nitrosomonas oligotropha TaxID=42354 RepID=A0A1H8TD69_9PROT|nr:tail protein X [Nitrosomonas oligotropha]SDX24414.1 P2-like prophage tail protein X [Nitrosomonas oligotropha]SEO88458.1 P2-like prophage tail protein X [Nitrosomonas oligotropha]
MAKTIRTSDGDRLDTLCYRHYGSLNGTVEAVIHANPGLAKVVQPFASGVIIRLPNLPAQTKKQIQLWS